MADFHLVVDEPPAVTTESRLFEYGAAWREAAEIAEAYRVGFSGRCSRRPTPA